MNVSVTEPSIAQLTDHVILETMTNPDQEVVLMIDWPKTETFAFCTCPKLILMHAYISRAA